MERSRWTVGTGDAVARVTRVLGDHERGDNRERRYRLDFPADTPALDAATGATCDDWTVTVPEPTRLARVRLAFPDAHVSLRLPGPVLGDALADAADGDRTAAKTVLNAVPTPESLPFLAGFVLDPPGVARLLDGVTDASQHAADAVHSIRYPVVRHAAVARVGLATGTRRAFESFAASLDEIDAIGDVAVADALCDLVSVAPDWPTARDRLQRLGYAPDDVADRDDGRFHAVALARIVPAAGLERAREYVRRHRDTREAYGDAKSRALDADYWERGRAWRDALAAAATESDDDFAFALANALLWTGAVARTDARFPELLHAAAADVAESIDLDGVAGRAAYARLLAVGHRHRSARNHDRAVAAFDRARALAADHDFLDAWEPLYSRSVVRANQYASAGRDARAVELVDDALDDLAEYAIPEIRRREAVAHLRGQKREAEASLEGDDPGVRRIHLEAAREHYDRAGLSRSVARVERKLDRADRDAESEERAPVERGDSADRGGAGVGPEYDPEPVGSADPGVIEDDGDAFPGR
ncbi:hypothetical protein [Salarchaeum japonicum]|uniref:Tetratricopeptide repeat protein n=1 Tax=Salarchaeum japonicum TaxID=555573 RepID=A0AAV3T4Q3_9EURY|nr:hypothetical protein [Salarchaeum japonicum]